MADELKGKSILIVDDDEEILRSLEAMLSETGADITTARDGNAGLEKALNTNPNLMILDLMMPRRSGFLVLESLNKAKSKEQLPKVIVITGNPGSRHRVYAESLGAALYLQKPFRVDRLLQAVKDLLT